MTPLLRDEDPRRRIRGFGIPSLVVVGATEPHHDPNRLAEVRLGPACEALGVDGADDSLDLPGDPVASVRAVDRVVAARRR